MDTQQLTIHVPREHPCFADHFADNPIVPGALLLTWLCEAIAGKMSLQVTQIKNFKFLHILKPGDTCTVNIQLHKAHTYNIVCLCNDTTIGKGQCVVNGFV